MILIILHHVLKNFPEGLNLFPAQAVLLLFQALDDIIEELKRRLEGRVKEAYLFGSIARSEKSNDSDIDIIIVNETVKPFVERALDFSDLYDIGCEMDILVYTPGEFRNLTEDPSPGFWKSVTEEMLRIV